MSNYIYDLEIALAHRRFGWTPSYVSRAGPCEYSIIDSNLEFFVLLELDSNQTLLEPSSEYYKLHFHDYFNNYSEAAGHGHVTSVKRHIPEEILTNLM